jgi:hypothetical protein
VYSKCGMGQVKHVASSADCGAEAPKMDGGNSVPPQSASPVPATSEVPKHPSDYLPWLGILITVGPAVGYLMAFLREWAYCNFFGIPTSFIRLDVTSSWPRFGTRSVRTLLFDVALRDRHGSWHRRAWPVPA